MRHKCITDPLEAALQVEPPRPTLPPRQQSGFRTAHLWGLEELARLAVEADDLLPGVGTNQSIEIGVRIACTLF